MKEKEKEDFDLFLLIFFFFSYFCQQAPVLAASGKVHCISAASEGRTRLWITASNPLQPAKCVQSGACCCTTVSLITIKPNQGSEMGYSGKATR